MDKKVISLNVVLILVMLLTGCKSMDYNDAKSAIDEQNYEVAFELLANLGDYKDCQRLLIDNINTYVGSLIDNENYDEALNILNLYSSAYDFSDLYNEIQKEKDLYDTYSKAKSYFENDKFSDGFELLDTLPSDYKNVQDIYNSYNSLKNCLFTGTHTNNPSQSDSSMATELRQQIKFNLCFSSGNFKLHVYKKVYWSDDGTISAEHDFYLDADYIDGNTIKYSSYTWTINNGRLTEVEKGQTYTYN